VDLHTLLRIVARRWAVVIPTLLVAGLVAYHFLSDVKPQYEAQASLLLLQPVAPATPAVPGGTTGTTQPLGPAAQQALADNNPYLPNAPLDKTAAVFAEVMNSDQERHNIKVTPAAHATGSYTVTVDNNAPILHVDVKDANPLVALNTAKVVMSDTAKQIQARQTLQHVQNVAYLKVDVVSPPVKTTTINAARTRAWIAFIALTLAAVLCVALLVESLAQSRRRRRQPRLAGGIPRPSPFPAPAVPAGFGASAEGVIDDGERLDAYGSETNGYGRRRARAKARGRSRPAPSVSADVDAPNTATPEGEFRAESAVDVGYARAGGRARAKPRRGSDSGT
jgi:capsular polysaccharide biosynthesis protein